MKGHRGLPSNVSTSLQIATIVTVTFAVYFNLLFNGFVIDDSFQIIGNRWIKDIRYIPEIFTSNFVLSAGKTAFYRPLIHVFYMITYHLFGLAPWGFHLMSIVLHTGVSVLVFLTIATVLRRPVPPNISADISSERIDFVPLAGALLFATHPIHTEAVAWISVTDIHMTFFFLLSFYLYAQSSEERSIWGIRYTLSVLSFFLATLCKEPALTLPAVLFTYDYIFRVKGKRLEYLAKRYIPFLLAGALYFGLRIHALQGITISKTPLKLSPLEYLLVIPALFSKYIEKLLLPVNLNVWHIFHLPETIWAISGIGSLLATALFFVIAYISIRKNRVALLGFAFLLLPLLPALFLPGLTQGLENAFTERYLYLPSFGFILLVALLIRWILRSERTEWKVALGVVLSVTLILYSYGAITRNRVWKDGYTIWSDTVQKSPGSAVPHNALGDVLREKGLLDEAIRQYEKTLQIDPGNPFSRASLGLVYSDKGLYDKAIYEIQAALRLKPDYAEAYDYLGVVYGTLGQNQRAIAEFETALKLNPELDNVYNHLGSAYDNLGKPDKAIEYFQKAIRINPDNAEAHNDLGITLAKSGNADKAIEQFHIALKLNPDNPGFHYNIANAYMIKGLVSEAEQHIRIAKELKAK